MTPKWQAKPGLSADEIIALNFRLKAETWEKFLPGPKSRPSERVLQLNGVTAQKGECASPLGKLCITSAYRDHPPKDRCLRRFMRAYWCAFSMAGLAKEIPNFPYLPYEIPVEECRSDAGEVPDQTWPFGKTLYAPLQCTHPPILTPNEKYLNLHDMIISPDAQTWKVLSCFAQVVLALGVAKKTLRFAHNALKASSVLLAPHAKIFSLNYGEISLLCADRIAIITGYSQAQYAYVKEGRVVEVPPDPAESTAMNLEAESLADVYALAKDCHAISSMACEAGLSRSTDTYRRYAERTVFFRKILEFFVDPLPSDPHQWPPGVSILKGKRIEGHLRWALEESGTHILRITSPYRGNPHMLPLESRESTWYTMDIRSLAAYGPPPESPPANAGPSYEENTHLRFLCSQVADSAINRILADPSATTPRDLSDALEEIPITLLLDPQARAKVMSSRAAKELYVKRMAEIMGTVIYRNEARTLTVAQVLETGTL